MSEAKFTKGGWSICIDCWADGHVSIDGFEHSAIAVVVSEMDDGSKKEELSANAHLIAAAPEMYEAMQEFVDRVECGEVRSVKTYSKFKAILAKARGEHD